MSRKACSRDNVRHSRHYWASSLAGAGGQAKLNALPQVHNRDLDGLDIHFIHIQSPYENALPAIITHGLPGSIIEMLNGIVGHAHRSPRVRCARSEGTRSMGW